MVIISNLYSFIMETKRKKLYEVPSMVVIEVKQGGVICTSEIKSRNSINGWENGGTTDDVVYF